MSDEEVVSETTSKYKKNEIIVKPEVEDKIVELIGRGRRYFGSSGASLTHELKGEQKTDFSKKALSMGLKGERKTTLQLKKWIEDKDNAVLVDSVHLGIKSGEAQNVDDGRDTDHVLIVGDSIILVDTKVWRKKRKYTINKNGVVLRGGRHFGGGKISTKAALFLWRKFFPEAKKVYSYVCIQQESVFVSYDKNWKKTPFKVVAAENLEEFLDYAYDKIGGADTPLDPSIAAKVIVSAIKPLDLWAQLLNRTQI